MNTRKGLPKRKLRKRKERRGRKTVLRKDTSANQESREKEVAAAALKEMRRRKLGRPAQSKNAPSADA